MRIHTLKGLLATATLFLFTANVHAGLVNFGNLGDGSTASLATGGVVVTGSGDVFFANTAITSINGGLGIGDNTLDLGETMTFMFAGLVDSVVLTAHDIPMVGNVSYGFNAFSGASDLGFFALPAHSSATESFDLSALVGASFDMFTLSLQASAPLGLVIEQLAFERDDVEVPSPGSLALLGLGLAGISWKRRKQK